MRELIYVEVKIVLVRVVREMPMIVIITNLVVHFMVFLLILMEILQVTY